MPRSALISAEIALPTPPPRQHALGSAAGSGLRVVGAAIDRWAEAMLPQILKSRHRAELRRSAGAGFFGALSRPARRPRRTAPSKKYWEAKARAARSRCCSKPKPNAVYVKLSRLASGLAPILHRSLASPRVAGKVYSIRNANDNPTPLRLVPISNRTGRENVRTGTN
jgi:hypothetical protein